MDRRNIAILAHADAGKTTLTERMLALCGAFKTAGSVDDGTAHTDTLGVERARGISVRSSAASGVWKDTLITIVDTPGHADFAAEVERGLWAVDGAVLAVSAVEGVQAQTELYFSALRELPGQEVALLSYMDPLVAVIASVTVLGEPVTAPQLVGGALILGFTLWNELPEKK